MSSQNFSLTDLGSNAPDAIYFLMLTGWRNEMRGNRWHWAKRWARHIPVIIVQPETWGDKFDAYLEDEKRLENVRILSIRMIARKKDSLLQFSALQFSQIHADYYEHGYKNPWAWIYNPMLSLPISMLPFKTKIMHLSEDWFNWEDRYNMLWKQCRVTLANSDLVISVSKGCAESAARESPNFKSVIITNGCDISDYGDAEPNQSITDKAKDYLKIAVFGGNVDKRIDYSLLLQLSQINSDVLFVIVGPQAELSSDDSLLRDRVLSTENVTWFDRMRPNELATIYKAAHVGIIPFKCKPYIVESQFSLKLYEMAATGLPILTTKMNSVACLNVRWICTANTDAEYLEKFRLMDKRELKSTEIEELENLARKNDYDNKFEQALNNISCLDFENNHENSSLDVAVTEGLISQSEAFELDKFKQDYLERPVIINSKSKSQNRKITVPILSLKNSISRALIEQRNRFGQKSQKQ